jgi:nucleoside recognition membrane protein YjiH
MQMADRGTAGPPAPPAAAARAPATRSDVLKFLLPTLVGAAMFLIPIRSGETITIGVGFLASWLQGVLGGSLPSIGVAVLCLSVALTAAVKLADPAWSRAPGWRKIFHIGWGWFALRLLGAVFGVMTLLQMGPEVIRSGGTGGVILNDLIPALLTFFLFALILLPFLVEFGLMEFIGTVVRAPFCFLFGLPGRSAVDAAASWMGAAPLGVLITYQQYERGFYSQREASVIATNFSVASIAFTLLITGFIGLNHMFVQFYFTVAVAGLVTAVILPRIPPLSRKRDVYHEAVGRQVPPEAPAGAGLLRTSVEEAAQRARSAPGARALGRETLVNIGDIFFGLLPLVMAIGTAALVLAEYTPVFTWISYPIVPVLELLRIPEAAAAAPAAVVGFADMFLPAVLLAGVESELTRFVIGCLSLTQLIYMSEIGVLILKSSLPLSFLELASIFLLRTAITLPIIALMAHVLFF